MYRKSIFCVAVHGHQMKYIFVVAAITRIEAISMVQEYIKEEGDNNLFLSELYADCISDQDDVVRIAVDAAIDKPGVLYCNGYAAL